LGNRKSREGTRRKKNNLMAAMDIEELSNKVIGLAIRLKSLIT
jgi:hypothetical protein